MILFCGFKNPKDKEYDFKIGKMKMDKNDEILFRTLRYMHPYFGRSCRSVYP